MNRGDLIAFKKSLTSSKSTELLVYAAEKIYGVQSHLFRTALHESDSTFSFGIGSNEDLVVIKKSGTGSNFIEIHVVSAVSSYQSYSVQSPSILSETDTSLIFLVASNNDIFVFNLRGEKHIKLTILSAASNYKTFTNEFTLPVEVQDGIAYDFSLSPNHDIFVLQYPKSRTNDLHTVEVSALAAATYYATYIHKNVALPNGNILNKLLSFMG